MKLILAAVAGLLLACVVYTDASCTYHARQKRGAEPVNRFKRDVTCDASSKYRRADGKCNNLDVGKQNWGSAGIAFIRPRISTTIAKNAYNNNIGTPRKTSTSTGGDLPNPRTISNKVHFHLPFPSKKHSAMVMQWGQFIDHDITLTPKETDENGDDIVDCCSRSDSVLTSDASPCFPINVPFSDPYYPDGKCINLVRSKAFPGTGTSEENPREQYNAVSAFIDGSMIYGSSDEAMSNLRDATLNKGQLRVSGDNMLPQGNNADCHYDEAESQYYCFKAGDERVNAFFGLGGMQTLFMREHNRLALELSGINPTWDDEKLFQEARRIVIAELQVITFKEWIPELLDSGNITKYNLGLGKYNYNVDTDPSLSNVFSSAAFRFGHSMVPENFTIGQKLYKTVELFKETRYVIDSMRDVMESLMSTTQERTDAWYVDSMRNRLDERDSLNKDGADIVALNIQRGRDHGLPSYNDWREECGLDRIRSWVPGRDITSFGRTQGRDLQEVYNNVLDDIDLYSGAISEIPSNQASLGPLYSCLVGRQLEKLRDGDRLWWESTDPTTGFTQAQRDWLQEVTLSRVICDNAGFTADDAIPTNAFRFGSRPRACRRISKSLPDPWQ